jgi:hypothetical protein
MQANQAKISQMNAASDMAAAKESLSKAGEAVKGAFQGGEQSLPLSQKMERVTQPLGQAATHLGDAITEKGKSMMPSTGRKAEE